jgi:hydroxymethylglutaryl-CoA reductase
MNDSLLRGFSKYNKEERINALIGRYGLDNKLGQWLGSFESGDQETQKVLEELSENTLTSFHLPYSVAPNFVVTGRTRCRSLAHADARPYPHARGA